MLIIKWLNKYINNYKSKGGNQYLFDFDSRNISRLNEAKNNDVYFKYLIEVIAKNTYSTKRKYLFDLTKRNLITDINTISNEPHTILNLRNQINLDEIKYISTIEFDEDYKNKHWVKSILSDCVNMAIMIQPEIFDNKIVLESDISNKIIPFKNIHFIYKTNFILNYGNMEKMFYKKIDLIIKKINLNGDLIKTKVIIDTKNKFDNLLEAFKFIYNDNNLYVSCIFNFITDNFKLIIHIYDISETYNNYVKCVILTHLNVSDNFINSDKIFFENYKQALLNYQITSDYFSKLLNINSLTNTNLQITLKNNKIICPNPDCFMIEFK